MALARGRRERGIDYWPGFVDALSTLVLGIIFLLTVFVVVQFFLSQEVAGKDTALVRLNAQIAQLTDLLSLEKTGKVDLEDEIARMRASLAGAETERDRLRAGVDAGLSAASAQSQLAEAQGKITALTGTLDNEKKHERPRAGPGRNPQPADRGAAPPARRARSNARCLGEEGQGVAVPHRRSRPAAQRGAGPAGPGTVALSLGFLRQAARDSRQPPRHQGGRRPLRVPVRSVLRFRPGGAQPGGPLRARQARGALLELDKKIPDDIAWVLRVDGHTDVRPIASSQFPSNWALSAARAISVVQYLISKGVSPQRLVAAGFGEFQPLDPGTTEEAFRRNRRLELKLTER